MADAPYWDADEALWRNHSNTTFAPITLVPSLPGRVHTPVTVVISVVCVIMTLLLVLQIVRIHLYGYRRLTCFYACLWMCLLWGLLRSYLLLEYAIHDHVASGMALAPYIIVFVLPACLQFGTFSLITLYFSTFLSMRGDRRKHQGWERFSYLLWTASNAGVFAVSVYGAIELNTQSEKPKQMNDLTLRVLVTEIFSLLNIILLGGVVWRIKYLVGQGRLIVEGYGSSISQILIFAVGLELLFLSRFIYNMVAMSDTNMEAWGYRWTFLSDHADRDHDDGKGYIFFCLALFLWEIMPVFAVIWFFWVRKHMRYNQLRTDYVSATPTSVYFDHSDDDDDENDYSGVPPPAGVRGSRFSPNDPFLGINSVSSYGSIGTHGTHGSKSY